MTATLFDPVSVLRAWVWLAGLGGLATLVILLALWREAA